MAPKPIRGKSLRKHSHPDRITQTHTHAAYLALRVCHSLSLQGITSLTPLLWTTSLPPTHRMLRSDL